MNRTADPLQRSSRPILPLVCLALTHTLVDACALLIAPLWPRLESTFGWASAGLSLAFIVQSLPTSVSQAVFGYFRDRRPSRKWLWLGPMAAAMFLPLMGVAPTTAALFALLIVGGVGVGAFHPEAAVTAGRLFPRQRTRALSVFMLGGALGLALGPTLSGFVVARWGLSGLVFVAPPMLAAVCLLWRIGRLGELVVQDRTSSAAELPTLPQMLEGRGRLAAMLLLVCSLRLVPNMALDKVLAFALERRGYGVETIGQVQTLFLASASVGMFVMAFRFRSGWEKPFMIGCPLLGAPLLIVLGWEGCPTTVFLAVLSLTGVTLWGTTPAMVSYAQQQFPRGSGLASAITMGLAWGAGGLMQAPITAYFEGVGRPLLALWAFVPCLLAAAAGAWLLPGVGSSYQKETSDADSAFPRYETAPAHSAEM